MRYEPEAAETLVKSARFAREMGHGFVGTAHILLAICACGSCGQLLRAMGATTEVLEDLTGLS